MRAQPLTFFLPRASDIASSARWPLRPAPAPGVPASGNSSPGSRAGVRCSCGGTGCGTGSRSPRPLVAWSTARWGSPRPWRLSTEVAPTLPAAVVTAWEAGRPPTCRQVRPAHAADRPGASGRPSSLKPLPAGRPPTTCPRALTAGWHGGDVSPIAWHSHVVS